jgi:siroheme synthase-like protein
MATESTTVEDTPGRNESRTGNNLFPVFLKLENLRVLIIGGGYVAGEKLTAVLANSPATNITMVASNFSEETRKIALKATSIQLHERAYQSADLQTADVIFVAVNDIASSEIIRNDAHAIGKLVNVADKPELCDYYLSSVVKKGNLKVAISTNGKSPTIAKRLKETFEETLPAELDAVLDNMEAIRNSLRGDFNTKVNELNEITKTLRTKKEL